MSFTFKNDQASKSDFFEIDIQNYDYKNAI